MTDVKFWLLYSNTWNHLTVETIAILVCEQITFNSFKKKKNYACKHMTDVKFWLLYSNTWNHLTVETIAILVCEQITFNSFKKKQTMHANIWLMLNSDCYIAILETI